MREWGAAAIAALVMLASGCSPESGEAAAEDGRAELERVAELGPAELVEQVGSAYDETVMRVQVTRTSPEAEGASYVLVARGDAWRVELPAPEDATRADGRATLLAVDDQVCFDRRFRPRVTALLAESYGRTEFDRKPWSCTATRFGLNTLTTFDFEREDPRWRIESFPVEQPGYSAAVEELDGEPLVHVRLQGVTRDGPLAPERPAYDLWVDGDRLPVRMETDGMRWDFEYDADLARDLTLPPEDERGSYGYVRGPGSGRAKACFLDPRACPTEPLELTWGDGRRSSSVR